MPLVSNCPMMSAWHQGVSMSGHVEESETEKKNVTIYTTSMFHVYSTVCSSIRLSFLHSISKLPLALRINLGTKTKTKIVNTLVRSCYQSADLVL